MKNLFSAFKKSKIKKREESLFLMKSEKEKSKEKEDSSKRVTRMQRDISKGFTRNFIVCAKCGKGGGTLIKRDGKYYHPWCLNSK